MKRQYAVIGNPIDHSQSPYIHRLFADQCQQKLEYTAKLVAMNEFRVAADAFFQEGGHGLNVTIPFKQDAFQYAEETTERATAAQAVNTLIRQNNGLITGDNTDGTGLVTDLLGNLNWELKAKRILVLGAGGAVRGILQGLLDQQPQHIVIANRTVEKALQLSRQFAGSGYILGCSLDMLDGQEFDIIINGTSASLDGEALSLPDTLIGASSAFCYDLMYGSMPTPFLVWAEERGARVSDGLGMLVEQAAESFYIWRGVRPDTNAVINSLRQRF